MLLFGQFLLKLTETTIGTTGKLPVKQLRWYQRLWLTCLFVADTWAGPIERQVKNGHIQTRRG